MKKLFTLLAALLLLGAMTVQVSAAGGISATNALGKAGQTVEITVSLDEAVKADQLLVEYSFDKACLTPQPKQSKWHPAGTLSNFHDIKYMGAWAAGEPVAVQGELCTLTFLVKPGVSFDTTKISCTVTVMQDSKEIGKYSTTARVTTSCSHSYGIWVQKDNFTHEKVCEICGDKQSQVHSWDEGKMTADPKNQNNSVMVHTCTVCRGTRSYVVEGVQTPATQPKDPQPEQTEPQQSKPQNDKPSRPTEDTQPQWNTQPEHTSPTQERDPFTGEIVGTQPTEHQHTDPFHDYNEPDHTHPETTAPMFIEHDHAAGGSEVTPYVVAAVVAVLLSALVYFVKKKT